MFLTIQEMKDVLYAYQMDEIAEGDAEIIENGILAGVSEVKMYFTASNQKQWGDGRPKYDVAKIFGATGADRDSFVLRMCKTVAAWNICELANPDVIYEHVKERYDNVIKTLEKIAGIGDYSGSPTLTPDLPTIDPDPDPDGSGLKPFRYGSRKKFNHE
ncbi:MAG: DUF1320 domain-containing protein [Tannerella sp.]|jgi:hypothetical protein|nr:DUF1320 domain-containing protein [Tannerella sp.]